MKRPGIAALLGLLFGPLGYLYLGWEYCLASGVSVLLFVKTLDTAHMVGPVASWPVTLLIQVGLALEAAAASQIKNGQLVRFWGDEEKLKRANVAAPITIGMDLFVRLVLLYLAGLGLFWSIRSIASGKVIRALAQLAGTVFGLWVAWSLLDLISTVLLVGVLAGSGLLLNLWQRWKGASLSKRA